MIEKSLKSETPFAQKNEPSSSAVSSTGKEDSQTRPDSRKSGARGGTLPDAQKSPRLYEVEIAGVPLRLKSSHDEQTVNELIAFVDHKVKDALSHSKSGSIQNAAILASLHLAEEYLLLKRKAKVELDGLEAKTQKVISELESSRVNTGLPHN